MEDGHLKNFFFPKIKKVFLIRLAVVIIVAYVVFGYVCLPMRIQGASMEPTYHDGGFNFCWTPSYWFSKPRRGDIVMVRLAGNKVMYLKRVVAFGGETVEFRNGRLIVDGKELDEPYVKFPCDWNREPLKVEEGKTYVVGDNRDMNILGHEFGETSSRRIVGKPLW